MTEWQTEAVRLAESGMSWRQVARELDKGRTTVANFLREYTKEKTEQEDTVLNSAKILFVDVETAPLCAALWSMWQQGVSLNQIQSDWYLLSFCASWAHSDEVIYRDLRGKVSEEDDYSLCEELFDLLNEAHIIVAHNGRKFDAKKINARLILNGFPKPSPYRIIDTLEIAKEQFAFTSNKLEYLTDNLCTDTKKSKHGNFPGYALWKACLEDNTEAWEEMRLYNTDDVLSLKELYTVLSSWSSKLPSLDVYVDDVLDMSEWVKDGFSYTNTAKYQVYLNTRTGQRKRSRINLLTKEKRQSLLVNV